MWQKDLHEQLLVRRTKMPLGALGYERDNDTEYLACDDELHMLSGDGHSKGNDVVGRPLRCRTPRSFTHSQAIARIPSFRSVADQLRASDYAPDHDGRYG